MLGIKGRLILTSTLLMVVLIGAFGWGISMQSRRLIDQSATAMNMRTRDGLKRAGKALLQSIVETSRLALVQNDYATIQETIQQLARRDKLVLAVSVVDKGGTVVAHSSAARLGKKTDEKGALFGKKKGGESLVFKKVVSHERQQLATVQLAYSTAQLRADAKRTAALKREELRSTLTKTLTVGVLALLLGVALSILQAVRITRPISEVAEKADQIANGDLLARVEVTSTDELGLLADRFNYMAGQVAVLLEHAQQKAFLEQELELASAVQATLVPTSSTVDRPGLALAGHFQPASRCAGDWWDFYELSGERTLFVIGDVTGHGVAAAMITAAAKGAASTSISRGNGESALQDVLDAMNSAIFEASQGQFVMTCFAAIYDPKSRVLEYANAGHNFPIFCSPKAGGKASSLVARGNRLGDVLGSVYEVRTTTTEAGDVVVLFTDGITECQDKKGREFGIRRLRTVVKEHQQSDPAAVRDVLVAESSRFCGGAERHDDVTLIVGRFS